MRTHERRHRLRTVQYADACSLRLTQRAPHHLDQDSRSPRLTERETPVRARLRRAQEVQAKATGAFVPLPGCSCRSTELQICFRTGSRNSAEDKSVFPEAGDSEKQHPSRLHRQSRRLPQESVACCFTFRSCRSTSSYRPRSSLPRGDRSTSSSAGTTGSRCTRRSATGPRLPPSSRRSPSYDTCVHESGAIQGS